METTQQEPTTMALATPTPQVPPEVLEQVAVSGDLSGLTAAQRLAYYRAVCQSLGLNPLTKPFEYLTLNGKLRLYALRDCADQLRRLHGISITITGRERLGDLYLVTARARDKSGREDESIGAVALGTLKGDALANALMKAETKAKRRVTLSLAGLGWLDETEISSIPNAQRGEPPATADPRPEGARDTAQPPVNGHGRLPPEARISQDDARTLKRLAQQAFGYREGERRLRADLGFEVDESLTLRHIAAHTPAERYQALLAAYQAALGRAVASDVAQGRGGDGEADHDRLHLGLRGLSDRGVRGRLPGAAALPGVRALDDAGRPALTPDPAGGLGVSSPGKI